MRRRPAAVWVAAAEIPGELCVDSEAMMLARAVTRTARAARTQRWVSVAALESKVTTDEAKQELNRLKMALNEAELLQQKFSGAPAAIDFAAYKGKVDASLLALVEPRPFRPPPRHRRVSTPSSPRRLHAGAASHPPHTGWPRRSSRASSTRPSPSSTRPRPSTTPCLPRPRRRSRNQKRASTS